MSDNVVVQAAVNAGFHAIEVEGGTVISGQAGAGITVIIPKGKLGSWLLGKIAKRLGLKFT